jgi:hypothetical protein
MADRRQDARKAPAKIKPADSVVNAGKGEIAAADFLGALRRNLDALQRQLAMANNSFADFVVKEFRVDVAVQMRVNEMGVLQLVMADDDMHPQSVSRLYLTLAAVAKPVDSAPPLGQTRADLTPLADLTWLPPAVLAKCAQYEIRTAAEFLGLVADARLTTQITSMLKVGRAALGRWANWIRMLELPGISSTDVVLLAENGVEDTADLAAMSDKALGVLEKRIGARISPDLLRKWRNLSKENTL